MDQQKLRSLVFEKTGVKVDIDDPIFALVALNEAVLAEAVERHVAQIEAATQELVEQAGHAQRPARAARERPAAALLKPLTPAPNQEWRSAAIAAGAAVLCALLVLIGQAVLFKPAPLPAPIVQARELTAEQQAAIKNGEKLARAVQKLDQKSRNAIKAEMQKP
ncbi:MAG: hypothetical protein V4463_10435 [Pseudomonadota bacterium]